MLPQTIKAIFSERFSQTLGTGVLFSAKPYSEWLLKVQMQYSIFSEGFTETVSINVTYY